jgi:hypothetical protein
MKKLSSIDRDGVIFALLAITAIFSHSAIEAFVNFQIMQLKTLSNKKKKRKVNRGSVVGKIEFLCDSLGVPRIKNSDRQLWDDFTKITKEIRNFFIHPKPWEFPSNVEQIKSQIPLGKYAEVASGIIGYFYERTSGKKPTWLRRNEVFSLPDFKVLP